MCISSCNTGHLVLRVYKGKFWKGKEFLDSHLIRDDFSIIARGFAMGSRSESWVISILTDKDFI